MEVINHEKDENIRVCGASGSIKEYSTELRKEGNPTSSETPIGVSNLHRGEPKGTPGGYGYIYLTENLINHKGYIGQHHSSIFESSYIGSGTILQKAIAKYGFDNFEVRIIEWCQSKEELNDCERYWIKFHNAVEDPMFYNILPGGEGGPGWPVGEKNPMYGRFGPLSPTYGRRHTPEEIQKELENMPRLVGKLNGMYGKHHTAESNERNRQAHLGRKMPDGFAESVSLRTRGELNPMYGKHHTEEARKKIGDSWRGRHHSEETKKKMSEDRSGEKSAWYGRHHTEESKEKMRQAKLGKVLSDEARRNMSLGHGGDSLRPLLCVETGQIFQCLNEAYKYLLTKRKTCDKYYILRCAQDYEKGIIRKVYKCHWRFIDNPI